MKAAYSSHATVHLSSNRGQLRSISLYRLWDMFVQGFFNGRLQFSR